MKMSHGAVRVKRTAVRVPTPLHAEEGGLFFALLKAHGVPLPRAEYVFAPPRKWRFDYAWPDEWESHGAYAGNMNGPNVAVEVEGGAWTRGRHTRGKGFIADMEKYNEAAVRGWRVIRVTPQQLCTLDTIALIRRALTLSPSSP